MPVKITKLKNGKYRVSTPNGVHAKKTSKRKASAQQRLLNGIEHNPKFAKKVANKNKRSLS